MVSTPRNSADKFLSPEDFEVWLKSRQVTDIDVAEWLGVTRQTVLYYKKNGLSKAQALALSAIERGIPPWRPTDEDRERAKMITDTK